jgi:hypothetical protein
MSVEGKKKKLSKEAELEWNGRCKLKEMRHMKLESEKGEREGWKLVQGGKRG